MSLKIDPRVVLKYLNELGYRGVTKQQLKDFILDLKKLIKYDMRKECGEAQKQDSDSSSSEEITSYTIPHYHLPTQASLAKQTVCSKPKINIRIERTSEPCSTETIEPFINKVSYPSVQFDQSNSTVTPVLLEQIGDENRKPTTPNADGVSNKKDSKTKLKSCILPPHPKKSLKCDPVELYHKYKQDWKRMCIPGETDRTDLRWAIRNRLSRRPKYEVRHTAGAYRTKSNGTGVPVGGSTCKNC